MKNYIGLGDEAWLKIVNQKLLESCLSSGWDPTCASYHPEKLSAPRAEDGSVQQEDMVPHGMQHDNAVFYAALCGVNASVMGFQCRVCKTGVEQNCTKHTCGRQETVYKSGTGNQANACQHM